MVDWQVPNWINPNSLDRRRIERIDGTGHCQRIKPVNGTPSVIVAQEAGYHLANQADWSQEPN